jgi:hypothetical protein
MSKLFHVIYILLWSQLMVFSVDKIYYDVDYGMFHIIGLALAGICAGVQIAILIIEIKEGE